MIERMKNKPRTMTLREVAFAFRVSEQTYRKMLRYGTAPVQPLPGFKQYRFVSDQVEAVTGPLDKHAAEVAEASTLFAGIEDGALQVEYLEDWLYIQPLQIRQAVLSVINIVNAMNNAQREAVFAGVK
jgi:hypothetical protein